MNLDIRLPIGALFLLLGLFIAGKGMFDPAASQSVGTNINLTWGIVLLVFGAIMFFFGRRAKAAK